MTHALWDCNVIHTCIRGVQFCFTHVPSECNFIHKCTRAMNLFMGNALSECTCPSASPCLECFQFHFQNAMLLNMRLKTCLRTLQLRHTIATSKRRALLSATGYDHACFCICISSDLSSLASWCHGLPMECRYIVMMFVLRRECACIWIALYLDGA